MRTIDMVSTGRLTKWMLAIVGILMIFTVATRTYGVSNPLLTPAIYQSGGLYNAELTLGKSADQKIPLGITYSSFSGTESPRVVHDSTIELSFKNVVLTDLTIK